MPLSIVNAQIVIGGHVYGGGNAGDTDGNTTVTIRGGDLNRVFGGARMADVNGRAFMNIDGANASGYIVINRLYGGNDISGTIGKSDEDLPEVIKTHADNNNVDKTWNALLLISTKTNSDGTEADDAQKIYIGQLFGGGDGEYEYGYDSDRGLYYAEEDGVEVATSSHELTPPNLGKTFLDIHGGSIVYAYGGGNNATVTEKTVISLDNPSAVVNSIKDTRITTEDDGELLTNDRFENQMGINTTFSYPNSDAFQIGRLFGGNNKADMAIRPRWNLQQGKVRNLYGGGNEGRMTSPEGLLLQVEGAGMRVDNVYGGCRKADVRPLDTNGNPIADADIQLDPNDNPGKIPGGYAARVRVLGGDVNNVYGGNDISGNVYGGNTVGIFSDIKGNVYGGGNGSYPYTDNADLKNSGRWGDFYYDVNAILGKDKNDTFDGMESAEALNVFRPNAEKVSILIRGTAEKPVTVGGALYVGGNSASLRLQDASQAVTNNNLTHIKIGSYAIIDKVFLGNNGENMISTEEADAEGRNEGVLRTFTRTDLTSNGSKYNSMNLTDADVFAKYMEGCAMKVKPNVLFESTNRGDPNNYIPYTTQFGSFYCGGNVGSMIVPGKLIVDFEDNVIIYDKVVGGCNNANVYAAAGFNAEYLGGLLGDPDSAPTGSPDDAIGDKLELNLSGLKIQPKRWVDPDNKSLGMEWNTYVDGVKNNLPEDASTGVTTDPNDLNRRFVGGNIYGGCYNTGHVNGNVIINIDASIVVRTGPYAIFDQVEQNEGEAILYGNDSYKITERKSGVILDEQGMDVLGKALSVFGGGYGAESEIWGSTTINLNKGYVFQVFGGGENGPIGNGTYNSTLGKLEYTYDPRYSCYVNLKGTVEGVYRGHAEDSNDMAEAEFIYGGSFEAPIAGNTVINLGNGRIFNSFAGSCNADILGHTETYVGRQKVTNTDGTITYVDGGGFPWIRDHIYGGNDLGGQILNKENFINRVSADLQDKVYNPLDKNTDAIDVTNASAYVEYIKGRVDYIFGGCYGVYDYTDPYYGDYTYTTGASDATATNIGTARPGFTKPRLENAFVNFKPMNHTRNRVTKIYGSGQGYSRDSDRDIMQTRSYILIDAPQTMGYFRDMEVFGAGDFSGLGMDVSIADAKANADGVTAAAVIDLMRGQINAVYGGSYNEGATRRTIVNVPASSTININNIFGGAYGTQIVPPCDVYESHVNFLNTSQNARVTGAIYGGNNSKRRTIYTQVNIASPVWSDRSNGYLAKVYGAGKGVDTWSEYTEVNLENGAMVYEVYGGGEMGHVLNAESVQKYMQTYSSRPSDDIAQQDPNWSNPERWTGEVGKSDLKDAWKPVWKEDWKAAWSIGEYYSSLGEFQRYIINENVNLQNSLVREAEMDDRDLSALSNVQRERIDHRYNTNVLIKKGATVANYAYGGGWGTSDVPLSGDVYGTTYIALLGGTVAKDIYAAGTSGAVYNLFRGDGNEFFTACSTAYIEGGTVRNVYGGGWAGSVGYHDNTTTETTTDIPGETHVVIGIRQDQASLPNGYGYDKGVPAIQRNAYGGGEGGPVFGASHLTLNNGYIGYIYDATADQYEEKVNDETWTDHVGADRLSDCGNLFGGGYDDNSSVDFTNVTVWGGIIRNSVFGGGEIATIGRGKVIESDTDNKIRTLDAIHKYGGTNIKVYNGHIQRNVFGGGKGYNILGYGGTHGFYTDGYVFGQTQVYIHGGEIGTEAGVAEGYGNVFGGGDVGFVYGNGYFSTGTAAKEPTGSPGHIYYKDDEGNLTEDCKVVIAPMLQIKKNGSSVTYGGKTYDPYDYVPTDYLNTLPADKTDGSWTNLYMGDKQSADDMAERGVHIRNAVFGGGNVSSNSESYNNATTVFGNTTATLYDVYHHDFITVGTEHTGGLYGGGNLSLVGGYRELNITNYGTDYYGLDQQISLSEYQNLTNRERAYFKLEYLCQQNVTISGKEYHTGDRVSEDDYNAFPSQYQNPAYWVQYGFCSIYAGRLLNTIQRADFCGVFGSRLVLQGAKDRVADVADATEYTINRIGEVSLNQQRSVRPADKTLKPGISPAADPGDQDPDDYADIKAAIHGNYFGIYSVVNYLGALTSDVHFTDHYRYIDKGNSKTDKTQSYYDWKTSHIDKRDRNNGTSMNQVALASGVFLELTSEMSTPSNKIYGTVTGVIELDLINVKRDIEGGGYVYARNEHGSPSVSLVTDELLSEYNKKEGNEALTNRTFIYTEGAGNIYAWQTSGNFIHKSKRIVDDCYPNNGVYNDGYVKSPAHYWFIKGEVYIYDQVVSAYAGSAAAYSKEVKIPLTITAGSNGRLQLLNVQPSLYAYYADDSRTGKIGSDGVAVDNESVTYHLNDVITWWDWHQLPQNEQKYFVKETRVNVDACTIDGTLYESGAYVLEDDKSIHATTAWDTFQTEGHTVLNAAGQEVTDLSTLFHPSNNIGHDTGYVLTLDMNSPKDWDDWYSPILQTDGDKITKEDYEALSAADKAKYREGPTYRLTGESGLYGQREYSVGEVISKETYDDYNNTVGHMATPPEGQAVAEPAYVALADVGNVQAGNAIGKTEYDDLTDKSNFSPAMICINTIQVGEEEFVLMGELISGTETALNTLAQRYMTYNNSKINADEVTQDEALAYVMSNLSNAYYIKSNGLYGGQYYQAGENYSAIKSWSTLTDARNNFDYNYDALDVLVDPQYHGEGHINTYYKSPYSEIKSVEYDAYYNGTGTQTYYDNNNVAHTISTGEFINRENYENVRNEQIHYTRLSVEAGSDTQTFYIVNETMINNGTPYAKGQDISEKDYNALSSVNRSKVDVVNIEKGTSVAVKYYCYEDYTPSTSFTPESGSAGQKGSIISDLIFSDNTTVPNYQKIFTIQGSEPTETTTLYVSRESNAKDVTSEKVISVVYQYTYYEADDEGEGVSLVNELHVLKIHLQLESGAPEIGPLNAPPAVIPGNSVGLKAPSVNPGLYEVLTSGWELFNSEADAELHRNGVPFTNNGTPLYWYQNQKVFLAFYSKTYLGKTYSNYVPLTVANYHDIDAIMKDTEHHLYVDHPDVDRNSKIYIDNRDCESDATKSELDLLKDFFDLSVNGLPGHSDLDDHVRGGADLEFILNSNVSPKAYTNWTPVGNDTKCFEGTFHGDGYTISGLSNSLFGNLCGSVYNLGVTGSFTSAGVADTGEGYVENCWINTTGTPNGSVKAVFGNPTATSGIQLVNSYYQEGKAYNTTDNGRGLARPMTDQEFYNGTVAYNLNGFYLNKRYYDKKQTSGTEYKYLKDIDGTLQEEMSTGYYPASPDAKYGDVGYVERRYSDEDFIYAGGTIPETYDIRRRVVSEGTASVIKYAPIWPDDYFYFGQMLNYGYNTARPHEDLPSHIVKSEGRLPNSDLRNRVYRAPAYYQSREMGVAHYNLKAVLAANSKPATETSTDTRPAYPNMTAIDFAGHNENPWSLGGTTYFYPPLLDNEDGLLSIVNEGETPNLLVYAPSAEANEKTYTVLTDYFIDPAYDDYYINDQYRRVNTAPTASVHGHLVQSNLKATNDHLLVDKRDFNCPISYKFADNNRMWYQRSPDRYVNLTQGWETVSLPFTAELVTTQQKGEITHFYSGSRSVDQNGTKTGHEYWLREYKGKKDGTDVTDDTFIAAFNYPTADGDYKTVDNTFLWDYYYSKNGQLDKNTDTYQTYYQTSRTLSSYPLLAAAKPYIVGFPSRTYYEFDLSGEWTAKNTADPAPAKLDKQVISFVSDPAITIGVSDNELTGTAIENYIFKPNYSSKAVEGYLLNTTGDRFDVTTTPTAAIPFRPYFVASNSAPSRRAVQHITFDSDESSFAIGDDDPSKEEIGDGNLLFTIRKHEVAVTSSLNHAADVRIVSVSGITIANFTIQPGETVERHIPIAGVYIVRADGGRIQKKIALK